MRKAFHSILTGVLCGSLIVGSGIGCNAAGKQNQDYREQIAAGQLGQARAELLAKPVQDKGSRAYMLQKLRTLIATVGDGYAYPNNQQVQEIFDFLRTQGINNDRTVLAAITVDGVQRWKGEPFEQAMAFHYIAMHFAMLQDWANMRAASSQAMFPLKSFGRVKNPDGSERDAVAEDIAGKLPEDVKKLSESQITKGYVVEPSDFALGYMVNGIANHQLYVTGGDPSRLNEAKDNLGTAVRLNPALAPIADVITSGDYNTVLFVDFGPGPQKYGRGTDNAIADFRPLGRSDTAPLSVRLSTMSSQQAHAPIACDVNIMAANHRWKNLEDVRVAKSYLGQAMMVGGAAALAYGAGHQDRSTQNTAAAVGLGLIIAGAVARASAHANVEYCEGLPQRVYVVPLRIEEPNSTVTLQMESLPSARMVLTNLSPPSPRGGALVRNVRLIDASAGGGRQLANR